MKRLSLILLLGVLVASASVAVASASTSATKASWSASKAEKVVTRDATVHLAGAERAALDDELLGSVRLFGALELAAFEEGDRAAQVVYHRFFNRYKQALKTVRSGLEVADARCSGFGRAIARNRFQQFDCLATSEVLLIPSTTLNWENALPAVLEGEPREVGPLVTQLRVHVTGKSSMTYE